MMLIYILSLFLSNLDTIPQTLHLEFLAGSTTVDIPDVISGALKVTAGVVALGDEDVVLGAVFNGLIERNWWALVQTKLVAAGLLHYLGA